MLVLTLAAPLHAGVAVSAEAGAEAGVPRISLQTSMAPLGGPALGTSFTPGLNAALAAPSAVTANERPAPLAISAVTAVYGVSAPKPAISAASKPDAPKGSPQTAAATPESGAAPDAMPAAVPAAEPGAPSFKTKILGMLRGLSNPFGKPARAPDEQPGDEPLHPLLTGESGDLGLDGLGYKGGRLAHDGTKARELGRGLRGVVDAHPKIPGAVVKTVSMAAQSNPMIAATESTPAALSDKEEKVARELEALGAGPRYFGRSTVEGRLVSVRERIYGKTLETLASERGYGPEEHALVLALMKKLSDAGVYATDMKAANIMIGRTAAGKERRAWLVDGGSLAALPAGVAAAKRLDALLDSFVPTTSAYGLGTSLRRITEKGLGRFRAPKAEPAPKSEAERLDREFAKLDVWGKIAPAVRAEIEGLRAARKTKAEVKEYAMRAGREAKARIEAAGGTKNVGFHYNLHGGQRADYVGKGIHATMGDIALQYSMHGDRNQKVYFFQSAQHDLYSLLDESHPQMLLFPSRMGHALNMFNVDAPEILEAKAAGRIRDHGAISMDFHGMGGVPYSTYLAPPVEVFIKTAKKVGLPKLSRDEETLATIRFLEAVAAEGGAYVPRRP